LIFFERYVAGHPREAAMMVDAPLDGRVMMLLTGPVVGVVSGLVLGLFAVVASKFVKPRAESVS
jgi:uncharacterized membrane protein